LTSVEGIDSNSSKKVKWASCSPWSKSLLRELRALLGGKENTLSKTQIIFKKRLSVGGKSLVDQVRIRTNAVSELMHLQLANGRVGEQSEGGNGVMTCVYFKGHIVQVVGNGGEME